MSQNIQRISVRPHVVQVDEPNASPQSVDWFLSNDARFAATHPDKNRMSKRYPLKNLFDRGLMHQWFQSAGNPPMTTHAQSCPPAK
jgi:hypothetical protein